jgi:hypothetical protein
MDPDRIVPPVFLIVFHHAALRVEAGADDEQAGRSRFHAQPVRRVAHQRAGRMSTRLRVTVTP